MDGDYLRPGNHGPDSDDGPMGVRGMKLPFVSRKDYNEVMELCKIRELRIEALEATVQLLQSKVGIPLERSKVVSITSLRTTVPNWRQRRAEFTRKSAIPDETFAENDKEN